MLPPDAVLSLSRRLKKLAHGLSTECKTSPMTRLPLSLTKTAEKIAFSFSSHGLYS